MSLFGTNTYPRQIRSTALKLMLENAGGVVRKSEKQVRAFVHDKSSFAYAGSYAFDEKKVSNKFCYDAYVGKNENILMMVYKFGSKFLHAEMVDFETQKKILVYRDEKKNCVRLCEASMDEPYADAETVLAFKKYPHPDTQVLQYRNKQYRTELNLPIEKLRA